MAWLFLLLPDAPADGGADIWEASRTGDLDRVSALLGEGVHVDSRDMVVHVILALLSLTT